MKDIFITMNKNSYDVVHIHGNSSTMVIELTLAKICRIRKRIVHTHNDRCNNEKINRILYPLFKKLYTDSLACSHKAGKWLFRNSKYNVLKNAIELENYRFNYEKREYYRRAFSIKDDDLVIGHVGNFIEQKNQMFLVDVFGKVIKKRKAKLVLVGVGKMQQQIKDQVSCLGLNDHVIFLNLRNDIDGIFQMLDIFAFPSKWEGLGMVLIEAQAAGLKCIVSENVPKEAQLTPDVTEISLNESVKWENIIGNMKLEDRTMRSENNIQILKQAGYDIECECEKLKEIYLG
jgi:glycosyltransferase involved in cell wall biosynthesis